MKLTDEQIVHTTAAQKWLTRAEFEKELSGSLRPGMAQAYVLITHLLRIILTHQDN